MGLEIRKLLYQVGAFKLGCIDLQLPPHAYLAIVGPSGAGKTMLLEVIAGLRRPHQGSILFNGKDLTPLPPERRALGFAYQDSLLFPFMNVRENILFGAKRNASANRPEIQQRLDELVEMMGLGHLLHRMPRFLSGGEKQRVSLARALLLNPPLLLLDEPLASLDQENRDKIIDMLQTIHRREAMTVIHVTHHQQEVSTLKTDILELDRGLIKACRD